MAWRIQDSVQRGEIDNRKRGIVRGRLWLHGLTGPITLELKGNAASDLAGCLLTFENPGETIPLRKDAQFNLLQRGTIGDLTASRKVRMWDLPFEEAYARKKKGLPVPEHLANSLYLEWFSEANGRVVVESADYKLTLSPPAWKLTPEEEQERQREAAQGFSGFVGSLSAALQAAKYEPHEDKEWNEFDYEKLMRESDARTDKYSELLEKYMDHPDRDRIVAKEMGWDWLEDALDEAAEESRRKQVKTPGAEFEEPIDDDGADADEPFALNVPDDLELPEPDPATEGVDWVRDKLGGTKHPLSLRAFESSIALWHQCKDLGLGKMDDDDLGAFISEFQTTGAKLAGALDGLVYGRDHREGGFIVACLKRTLAHLHAAQAAMKRVSSKNLLPANLIATNRKELFAIREEILRLMEEFRGSK